MSEPRSTSPTTLTRRGCRVLLVEPRATRRRALEGCGSAQRPVEVVHAATLAEARHYLATHAVDLAVLAVALDDGSGLDLAAEIAHSSRTTATIVTDTAPDFAHAQQALQAGADDFVVGRLGRDELRRRFDRALDRKLRDKSHQRRVERLHRLCKKLNAARQEVSQQVDILCNDLVVAYQELACQMQNVVQSSEYNALVRDELDLEALIRKTLEHLVAKLGASNAAIFLPATLEEYSLGGYVNYDCTSEAVGLLLDQLADTLAPRIAETDDLLHLTRDPDIADLVGTLPAPLSGCSLVALPCMSGDECLAVLTLFRSLDEPFTDEHLDRLSSLAPMLGDALEKIIRVHHRSVFARDPEEDDGDLPF